MAENQAKHGLSAFLRFEIENAPWFVAILGSCHLPTTLPSLDNLPG